LESRIISPDCYISIGGNKYSVPDIFENIGVRPPNQRINKIINQ
jgi:hypothetical protein